MYDYEVKSMRDDRNLVVFKSRENNIFGDAVKKSWEKAR